MLTPKTNRLLGMFLAAAVLPMLLLYALLMYISTPTREGGMEPAVTTISYFAFTFIFAALIIVFLNFALQLRRESRGQRTTP